MSQPEREIRTILVAGAGLTGLSAALAFARALPRTKVTLLALPAGVSAVADRLVPVLPPTGRLHSLLGIDELAPVRDGIAAHQIATRFTGWAEDGADWYHSYGDYGLPHGASPFHQLWVRARTAGRALPYHCYSAACALAEADKFVHPSPDPQSSLSTYSYALRLDPNSYRQLLLDQANGSRIASVRGEPAAVERHADASIKELVLKDGRRLEADLYLDCTGPESLLFAGTDDDFESWHEFMPSHSVAIAEAEPESLSPVDRVAAIKDGWNATQTLPTRTVRTAVLATGGSTKNGAFAIRVGARRSPWTRNVLAIGDSAAVLDPLYSLNLYLAHSAILRALDLLPGRDFHPVELAEYNRRTEQEVTRVRDFIALHYVRSGRTDGIWQKAGRARLPDTLAHTLQQFEARGRLPFYEEETFDRHSWTAAMFGLGIIPRACDAVAEGVAMDQLEAALDRLAKRLAALPQSLPDYPSYLQHMLSAGSKAARR